MITDSGSHIPARVDEKHLPEVHRRPLASSFDRLVEVNLSLTKQVERLVACLWVFMALMVIFRMVEVALSAHR